MPTQIIDPLLPLEEPLKRPQSQPTAFTGLMNTLGRHAPNRLHESQHARRALRSLLGKTRRR